MVAMAFFQLVLDKASQDKSVIARRVMCRIEQCHVILLQKIHHLLDGFAILREFGAVLQTELFKVSRIVAEPLA